MSLHYLLAYKASGEEGALLDPGEMVVLSRVFEAPSGRLGSMTTIVAAPSPTLFGEEEAGTGIDITVPVSASRVRRTAGKV